LSTVGLVLFGPRYLSSKLSKLLAADAALAAAAVAFELTAVAKALASVANTGSAPRNASALIAKFVGSSLLGGVGSNVILTLFP
jgi:hypothetical protein